MVNCCIVYWRHRSLSLLTLSLIPAWAPWGGCSDTAALFASSTLAAPGAAGGSLCGERRHATRSEKLMLGCGGLRSMTRCGLGKLPVEGGARSPLLMTWRGDLDKKKLQRQSQDMNIWQYSRQKTDERQKYCSKIPPQKALEIMGLRPSPQGEKTDAELGVREFRNSLTP